MKGQGVRARVTGSVLGDAEVKVRQAKEEQQHKRDKARAMGLG